MSDQPAGLPAVDDQLVATLQRVQDTGTHQLVDVDEAELVAVSGLPTPSAKRSPLTPEQIDAGGRRLVERGLAEPTPWQLAAYRPLGPLLSVVQLAVHPKAHTGVISSWDEPHGSDAVQVVRRLTLLMDVARAGQAVVEHVLVPLSDAPPASAVSISLLRLDVLIEQAVADATPPPGTGRETLVLFADARGRQEPSRYRVAADGSADIESSRHGLLGAKTVHDRADAAAFADHLRLRLMAAG
ncbi:hypothetical protein [uncultured Jatrophihabitans sp.]|uniref:hypothetical protein n=1 Tax=uncultured Jatrophihabitans sp. TaxID=1610747 RepID=UPI0035CA4561